MQHQAVSSTPASREPVRAVSRDRLYYSSLLCATSVMIFLGCVWLAYREAAASISVWAVGSTVFSALIALVTRRRRVPRRWLPVCGTALALAVYATLYYSFLVIRGPGLTLFLVMVVLAAGVMHSSAGWLAFTLVVTVGSWLVTGVMMFGASFVPVATGLLFSGFVAQYLHMFVVRHLAHLKLLRQRDRMHGEELSAALAAAQRELTERQRAETERERLREQLLHSQKLEAIGTLAGGVAHDMNNLLAAILGVAELARNEPSTAREGIEQIIEAAQRGSEVVRNLLGFSRRGQYRKALIELAPVVATITALLSRTLPKEVELISASTAVHAVEGDVAQLGQALLNLCINASDAMKGRGVLRIEVDEVLLVGDDARSRDAVEGRYVTLRVSDTGCGMDAATRSRMFEPFFTTKPPGRGTGLGLAMVYGTITNHGGTIAVDSELGHGTAITIYLPARERAEQAGHAAQAPAAASPPEQIAAARAATPGSSPGPRSAPDATTSDRNARSGAVLVVDDEPMIRRMSQRSLERAGYRVLTASDGAEGLVVFREHAADIEVVVLDMAMPTMGGAECFRHLRAVDPAARVLLASGYALEEEARECLAAGALGILEKPFTTARLIEAVASARADRRVEEHLALPAM
jgi:two-component system, cell cycle sensor histidine kinase and response regulator CckA